MPALSQPPQVGPAKLSQAAASAGGSNRRAWSRVSETAGASDIERTLRRAMKKNRISSLPIYPEDRPCTSPTMFDIVRLFRNVERYEVAVGDDQIVFPAELTKTQKHVLELLEIPLAAYQ